MSGLVLLFANLAVERTQSACKWHFEMPSVHGQLNPWLLAPGRCLPQRSRGASSSSCPTPLRTYKGWCAHVSILGELRVDMFKPRVTAAMCQLIGLRVV